MAKLSDAQTATLTRGAQRDDGLLSPAPKTPPHMALAMANKMQASGLVEAVTVPVGESVYWSDDAGQDWGYRVTLAGFRALGIALEERPAYTHSAMDDELHAAFPDWPAADDATLDAVADGADQPLVSAAALAASITARNANALNLRDTVATFLAAWDACTSQDATDNPISRAVAQMRLAMPTAKGPKEAKPTGEVGTPRAGSKTEMVIALLRRQGGATAGEIERATGWSNTSMRGFVSGLKTKRGLDVGGAKHAGERRYWIGDANGPSQIETSTATAKAAPGDAAF